MTHALNEKFFIPLYLSGYGHRIDVMDGRVSAISQKQISAPVDEIGGVSALRNNDKMLLYLDETVSQASNRPGGGRAVVLHEKGLRTQTRTQTTS